MYTTTIQFNSVEEAKRFVNVCNTVDFAVELVSGSYVVDAKSIMGIFSLDLSKPVELHAHCEDGTAFSDKIEEFIVA